MARWLATRTGKGYGSSGQQHLPGIARAERDGTRAETTFRLSPKRTSPFKSVRASVQSTAGSRGVRIRLSNAGYTTFRRSRESTGYPLQSTVSPSLPLTCVTVCHQVPNELYQLRHTATSTTMAGVWAKI